MNMISYLKICSNLILADLLIFRKFFIDKCIDLMIWIALTVFVTGYVMPYFGLQDNFGMFQLGGIFPAVGLFEMYSSIVDFVSDLQGDRVIDYQVTLPIPSWLAITAKATYYAIVYALLTIAMIPFAKVVLWDTFDLLAINHLQFFIAIVLQAIFCACFSIFAASLIDNMGKLGTVWSRFIFPMWFMGGFQFSWQALHHVTPVVAWIDLMNPMIYLTEATRAALLGQEGYLNFWLCTAVTLVFSAMTLWLGINNIKKRLDYI